MRILCLQKYWRRISNDEIRREGRQKYNQSIFHFSYVGIIGTNRNSDVQHRLAIEELILQDLSLKHKALSEMVIPYYTLL